MGGSASSPAEGCFGFDVSVAQPAAAGWWAAVALGGKLYGVPCSSECLLVYDPAVGITSVDTRRVATGEGKWRSAVGLGGRIYGVPDRAGSLLVYDVSTGKVGGFDTKHLARGPYKWQAAVALGGKVYGIPHHAEKLLVYDPGTDRLTGVPTTNVASGPSKWLAGIALRGKLYGVPCDASSILVYDPATGAASGVDIKHLATGGLKWLAAVTYDSKLYAVPCNAGCILVYDPVISKAHAVDTSSVAVGPGKWLSAVVLGGRIYGVPDHADSILVYDVASGVVSGVDITSVGTGPFKWQTAITLGGRIYAAPYSAEAILTYNPATGEASGVATSAIATGSGKWGTTAVLSGRLCGLPHDANQLLVYEPEGVSLSMDRSEDLPVGVDRELVHDFVAAWLSEWIYLVQDISHPCAVPSLSIGGKAIQFVVHRVYEDPLQGAPARLGTVTAAIPDHGKVVFLVFKGSSFLADFVANASVNPDFMPFHQVFNDSTTFVHHGAYHSMAQLRVHQWAALLQQLRTAAEEGVQHLVVTGHSLGGQYAMAFVLQVFLEESKQAWADEPELLRRIRSVSFGSPMCFGAAEGSEVRPDLADYMRKHSVNYINGGDPAPRLWSELNLEEFMSFLVGWLQSKVSSLSWRIMDYAAGAGGLAKRAADLLQRPDIEVHLLRPAARYVHLSPIRILAPEFRPWRPLGTEHISIQDHSMCDAYIPNFRAALEQSAVGRLYDEEGRELVDFTKLGAQ